MRQSETACFSGVVLSGQAGDCPTKRFAIFRPTPLCAIGGLRPSLAKGKTCVCILVSLASLVTQIKRHGSPFQRVTSDESDAEITGRFTSQAYPLRLPRIFVIHIDRRWRRKAARMVAASEAIAGEASCEKGMASGTKKILDVATGTADLAIELARQIPGVHITGCDISEEMMQVGRRKVSARGLQERISLLSADAEAMAFPGGEFDAVTVAFGVRNFQDIEAGIGEMLRVLRVGGEVFILEFSVPRGKIFAPLYRFYFNRILPRIGGMISRDSSAYSYLPGSVAEFAAPEEFLAMMAAAGFAQCSSREFMGGVAVLYRGLKI